MDGKAVAERLRGRVAARVAALPFRPGLRVVRVGDDPASGVYVRNKDRAALAAGFDSATLRLPADTAEAAWPTEGWWRNFHSPELDGLIASARAYNNDLAAAAARVVQADAQVRISGAPLLPAIDAVMGVPNYGATTAKAGLQLLGVLDNRNVRGPLVPLDDDEVEALRIGLAAAGLL